MRLNRPRRAGACVPLTPPSSARREPARRSRGRLHHDRSMQAQRVVDCHVHVFDPQRFPYRSDTVDAPGGQELGTPARLGTVLDAHGVEHALLVGPNSGYGEDNRCLLDTLPPGLGRYRGMAVVDNSVTRAELPNCGRRVSWASPQRGPARGRVLRRCGRPADRPGRAGHDRRRPGDRRRAGRARAGAGSPRVRVHVDHLRPVRSRRRSAPRGSGAAAAGRVRRGGGELSGGSRCRADPDPLGDLLPLGTLRRRVRPHRASGPRTAVPPHARARPLRPAADLARRTGAPDAGCSPSHPPGDNPAGESGLRSTAGPAECEGEREAAAATGEADGEAVLDPRPRSSRGRPPAAGEGASRWRRAGSNSCSRRWRAAWR